MLQTPHPIQWVCEKPELKEAWLLTDLHDVFSNKLTCFGWRSCMSSMFNRLLRRVHELQECWASDEHPVYDRRESREYASNAFVGSAFESVFICWFSKLVGNQKVCLNEADYLREFDGISKKVFELTDEKLQAITLVSIGREMSSSSLLNRSPW